MGDSIVDWQSKRQATASPSTLESECVAMTEAAKYGVYLQRLLDELGYRSEKVPLNCDNMGAISLANNSSFHSKTKHIDIRVHMICEYVEYGYVSLSYVRSNDQLADILTKTLNPQRHAKNVLGMGHVSNGGD